MELVRSFSNISFFFIVSLSFFIAIEHVRLKIIIRNTSDVIGNRSISLRKMNIILVPFLLPRNFPPFGKHARYPLSRQTSIVPPIVETKSPITRGRSMIKSFEIGTLPPICIRPPILHSLHRPVSNQCLTSQRFFPLLYSFFFPSREIKQCLTVKTRGKMRLEGFDIATEIFVS